VHSASESGTDTAQTSARATKLRQSVVTYTRSVPKIRPSQAARPNTKLHTVITSAMAVQFVAITYYPVSVLYTATFAPNHVWTGFNPRDGRSSWLCRRMHRDGASRECVFEYIAMFVEIPRQPRRQSKGRTEYRDQYRSGGPDNIGHAYLIYASLYVTVV
jgi:hypothetical protein